MKEKQPFGMHQNAPPQVFQRARELRKNSTPAERKLWEALRGKKLEGFKFRRQHPLGSFISDFYCHKVKLVIEVDGGYHLDEEQ